MTLPRLDPYVENNGEQMEDLSRIGAAQPYESLGPTLPQAALKMLVAGDRDKVGRAELAAAGLVTSKGKRTDAGDLVRETIRRAGARIRVESSRGRAPLSFEAYARGSQAVLVATVSPASLTEDPHGEGILDAALRVQLDVVDLSYIPLAIASWIGLSPAWSLATTPELIDEALLLQRLDDPAVAPPPDADAHLRYVWSQPWFLWTLTGTRLHEGRTMINAGGAGQFVLAQGEGDKVRFGALLSSSAWTDLVSLTNESLGIQ